MIVSQSSGAAIYSIFHCAPSSRPQPTMDEDAVELSPEKLTHHNLIDELSQLSVPENFRQAVTEKWPDVKLAKTHGAEPRTVAETTPSMAMAISSGATSSAEQTSLQVVKPGK